MTTELDALLAACATVQSDSHAARSTKAMAAALAAWAPTVQPPAPAPAPSPTPSAPPNTGAVLFEDHFTGTKLDTSKWDVKSRTSPSGTMFSPGNVSVHDGLLDIVATRDATSGTWTAGEIQGLAPGAQYVGPHYLECRAIVPAGAGAWAAPLWERDAPWGALGIENDVCEQLGKEPTTYHATVHNGPNESYGVPIVAGATLSTDFHVYGCAVYDDRADYYLDDVFRWSITAAKSGLTAWKFTTTPLVALIDLDMGGWGGTITATPPLHLLVDYVRVTAL